MRNFTDQISRTVRIPPNPKRIISLVPSQTELLFDLGLDQEIVGLTKFCVHPNEKLKGKTIIGGTKNFRFDQIDELQPDLIIGNKEENYLEGIDKLSQKYPVWVSDVKDIDSALDMIQSIGQLVGRVVEARRIIDKINKKIVGQFDFEGKRVVYLIWFDPIMVAGQDTFINDMLKNLNLVNIIEKDRYPVITTGELAELNPDYILLSSEPYPFKQKHVEHFSVLQPSCKTLLVDGEIFSWYGSRLAKSAKYLESLSSVLN